jgi:hypothetical protein
MANYQPEFWFRGDYQPMFDAAAQHEVANTMERAAKAFHTFDRSKEPYAVDIELVEHSSNRQASLAEFCQQMIETLTAPRKSTGGRRCQLRWLAQLHAAIRFVGGDMGSRVTLSAHPDLHVQPAGSLLVDIRQPVETPEGKAPLVWEESVQSILQQHPLARAGAEYAVAVDFPLPFDSPDRAQAFESGFVLIQQIEHSLPATKDQRSMIPEFWLNYPTSDDETEPHARLRVWRLGVMQVATATRQA